MTCSVAMQRGNTGRPSAFTSSEALERQSGLCLDHCRRGRGSEDDHDQRVRSKGAACSVRPKNGVNDSIGAAALLDRLLKADLLLADWGCSAAVLQLERRDVLHGQAGRALTAWSAVPADHLRVDQKAGGDGDPDDEQWQKEPHPPIPSDPGQRQRRHEVA